MLRKLIHHPGRVGKAGPEKDAGGRIPAPTGDQLAVRHHVELTDLVRGLKNGIDAQARLDYGGETRRLSLRAASSPAVTDIDFHLTFHAMGPLDQTDQVPRVVPLSSPTVVWLSG